MRTFTEGGRLTPGGALLPVQGGGVGPVVGVVVGRGPPEGAAAVGALLADRSQLHLVMVDPEVRRLQVRRADLRLALHVAVTAGRDRVFVTELKLEGRG